VFFAFDTNTLISSIIKPGSVPSKALNYAQSKGKLVFSEETKEEFLDVVGRDKFDRFIDKALRVQKAFEIVNTSIVSKVDKVSGFQCRDEADIKFLQLIVAVHADCLVSGDKDLLVLHPFKTIPILTPSQFMLSF